MPNSAAKRPVNRSAPLVLRDPRRGHRHRAVRRGHLPDAAARAERQQDHPVGGRPVRRRGRLAAQLGGDVGRDDLRVLHRVPGALLLVEVGDVTDGVDAVVAPYGEGVGDRHGALRGAGGEPAVGQVVAVEPDAVRAEPQVRGDGLAAGGGDRERLGPPRRDGGRRGQRGAEPQRDAALAELAEQVRAQLRQVAGQQRLDRVDDRHRLARPRLGDLPGQLQADRSGAEDQHVAGAAHLLVRPAQLLQGVAGGVGGRFGRVGVRRAGRQHHEVRRDALTRGQRHPAGVRGDHPVAPYGAAGEQRVVGEEHVGRPVGPGQRPQRPRRVDERVPGVDQHHVGLGVQRLGDRRTSVPSADDHDRTIHDHASTHI